MGSRLVIWLLLLLVPFQGLAAVGLVHCTDGDRIAVHADHADRLGSMAMSDHLAMDTHTTAGGFTATLSGHEKAHAAADKVTSQSHHHAAKSPCCNDIPAALITNALPASSGEHFSVAIDTGLRQWQSVVLEGPKRPPRLTLS